jgi:serine protease Do
MPNPIEIEERTMWSEPESARTFFPRAAGKRAHVAAIAAVCMMLAALPASLARAAPNDFTDLVRGKLPAVVNISTTTAVEDGMVPGLPPGTPFEGTPFEDFFKRFFDEQAPQSRRPRPMTALGSGFIIDAEGYVVTNNHVVERADEIKVILHDDTELAAELVGRDPKTDLALLKVDAGGRELPALTWGDSDTLEIGAWVVAIGNPFGLGGSVTAGIVSAHSRDIQAGPYDDFIQTDASINQGNSGGPLFDTDGKVVGVNTAILSPSGGNVGIGFAVPSNMARPIVEQLRQTGSVKRGWLGVSIQPVTEAIAQALGLPGEGGAIVASVEPDSPADKAGIESGDVILSVDDRTVEGPRELARIVAGLNSGKSTEMVVWRQGDKRTLSVEIGELQQPAQAASGGPDKQPGATSAFGGGARLGPLTQEVRERYDIADTVKGVIVAGVEPGSLAAERGVRTGDVMTKIGERQIENLDDVQAALEALRDERREDGSVLVLIDRGGRPFFTALPVDEAE